LICLASAITEVGQGPHNFKNGSHDLTTPTWWWFATYRLGLAMVGLYTKVENSASLELIVTEIYKTAWFGIAIEVTQGHWKWYQSVDHMTIC